MMSKCPANLPSIAILIHIRSGIKIFQPFHFLPPRALKDYYEVIRRPVSLDAVRKKVRGIHGKATNAQATHITDFTSWASFEDEVSYIWKNCRDYNEDGSEMYQLAGEFEVSVPIDLSVYICLTASRKHSRHV